MGRTDASLLKALRGTGIPVYGLASPQPLRRWLAEVGAAGISVGHELQDGVEISIGFTKAVQPRDAEQVPARRDAEMRQRVADGLTLRAAYPPGGARDMSGSWWEALVDRARDRARNIAASESAWQSVSMTVDRMRIAGWSTRLEGRWASYATLGDGYLLAEGSALGPEQIEIVSIEPAELDS
jgi:hypothetical protein